MTYLQQTTTVSDCTSFSYSAWFYLESSSAFATTYRKNLINIGLVPEGFTGTSNIRLDRILLLSSGVYETKIYFERWSSEAPFDPPQSQNFAPQQYFYCTNRDSNLTVGTPLYTSGSWLHLAAACDWSVGDHYSNLAGNEFYTINTQCVMVLNAESLITKPGVAFALTSGPAPNWFYFMNDGYLGVPSTNITSRVFPMQVNGDDIGSPVNATNASNDRGRISKAYEQVWFGKFIDWTQSSNFSTVASISSDGILSPAADVRAAQDAFGASDVWFVRDSISGIKFEDNQGTAGDFTVIGTEPEDFEPPPSVDLVE